MAEAQKSAAQAAGGRRGGLLRNLGPILALLPLGILAWPSLLLGGALLVPTLAAAIKTYAGFSRLKKASTAAWSLRSSSFEVRVRIFR